MQKNIVLYVLGLLALSACGSKNAAVDGCYVGVVSQDSVFLNLETTGGQVSGNLHYKFLEKDMNTGAVSGQMMGDTLLLNYNFQSEGTQSVRQVAFLVKDGKLTEGYGDMVDGDQGMRFKDLRQLNFGNGFVLQPTTCTTQL